MGLNASLQASSTPFTKAFQPHGFHDACNLLMIGRAEVRIVLEASSDAYSPIKPVLNIEDALIGARIKAIFDDEHGLRPDQLKCPEFCS